MNITRFIGAGIAVFITLQILDFLIHGLLLGPTYENLKEVWRPDMVSKMWIMYATSLIMSFLFVYLFIMVYKGKGVVEGIRYGLLIGLFINVASTFNQYVIYPIPFILALQWFIYETFELITAGIIVSCIYKPRKEKIYSQFSR